MYGRYREDRLGDYTVLCDQWNDGRVVVQVNADLRVHGPAALIEAVLNGKPRAGRPAPDVLAFVGGDQRLLAYFCANFADDDDIRDALHTALPDATWPDDDKPAFAGGRLRATGDVDDPHLTIELVLRHGTAGDGLAATETAVAAALERVAAMKETRLFRPLLAKIEHQRDGTDAVWRLDLGRARQAAGMLGTLAPFLFVARTVEAQVLEAEAVAEAVEAPAPEPKKEKEKEKEKGK
jgi:hypothetical protein